MSTLLLVVAALAVLLVAVSAVWKPKKRPQEPPPQPQPAMGGGLDQLKEYLKRSGKHSRSICHRPEHSASMRAAVMHESGKSVAKAVVFCRADGVHPVMFVVSAADRVDLGIAQTLVGSDARLATETELGPLFPDCQLGAHPPFGSFYGIRTILDEGLRQDRGNIIFLLGHHDESTSMAMSDYAGLAKQEIRRIRQRP